MRLTGGELAQIELKVLATGGSHFDFYRAVETEFARKNKMEVE